MKLRSHLFVQIAQHVFDLEQKLYAYRMDQHLLLTNVFSSRIILPILDLF
jgi:hypothetical protein